MATVSVLGSLGRRLEGKVALITGGASGIGACTARLFAQHGARIVVADVQDSKGQALCSELGHEIATYVHCNITNESHVRHAVDSAVTAHGKLDIMFNNAGTAGEITTRILESKKRDFEDVLATNLVGSYLGTKHAARVMIPRRQGSIVITASVASVVPGMTPLAYTCSKHGVVGLMRSTAVELGQFGVRVNCVSPYALATPLAERAFGKEGSDLEEYMEEHGILKGARLKKEDVADAVLYLGSDEAKYVSGHNLIVDGAFTAVNPSHGLYKYSLEP